MASISIHRHHHLGLSEARDLVVTLARSLEKELSAKWRWEGDELRFERVGASGLVRVAADQLAVEIKLGLLLRPLRDSIAAEINERLDNLLGPVA
jgi:putative polyhydroxyalkanoate system protein